MIKNYLKIAYRNLIKNKLYSLINIGGLAVGIAVSFILLLYVYNEFNFDKFNVNKDRLYRVYWNQAGNGDISTGTTTPAPLAPELKKDFPEIEKVTRTNSSYDFLINYKEKALKVKTMAADISLLDMFTFEFIYGNKQSALTDPSTIVLTQTTSEAIFGNINPVGQILMFSNLMFSNKFPLRVSGVIKDNPQNSSFDFKALISWQTLEEKQPWTKTSNWWFFAYSTYIMLKPNASFNTVNSKIKNIIKQINPENKETNFFIYPYIKQHLYSNFTNGVNTGGSIEYVKLFLFLSIGILIIACINFMNLSTARSAQRAREVGVRKAIGASRLVIIQQFMGESILMTLLAFVISLALIQALLPFFNNIINIQLTLPYNNLFAWLIALSITIFTGVVAGSYPALFLSSFKPVKVLKGQLINTKTTVKLRQVLVIVQFTFAICLILFSVFIYKQINYIKDRPVGYDQSALIEMPVDGNMMMKFNVFRQDAINSGAITDGALISNNSITNDGSRSWGVTWSGQLPGEEKLLIDQIGVSYHFVNTFGLKLIAGRDFAVDRPSDSTGIMLNEAAVKLMRFNSPIGQIVNWQGAKRTVVGIVKDFVWDSPYEPVKPAIIGFMPGVMGSIGLKLNSKTSIGKSLAILQALYKKHNPEYPFEYKFTDENFSKKFANEKLLGTMAGGFTCLAIVISCLGLFGLASFSAEQRTKEIGIRKVLGASTSNIWFKLSQEFVQLVLISFLIGSAISWYYIQQWLSKYTFHTTLSIWVFLGTMIISLMICLITVSWQAIKAAWTNPINSLRSE